MQENQEMILEVTVKRKRGNTIIEMDLDANIPEIILEHGIKTFEEITTRKKYKPREKK